MFKLILVSQIWLWVYGFSSSGRIASVVSMSVASCILVLNIIKKVNKKTKLTKEEESNIEKIMREPKGLELSDKEEKIRRNLLLASTTMILFNILGLEVTDGSRFLGGLQFNNLTTNHIYIVFSIIITYKLAHYTWLVINQFLYWRVRLTGIESIPIRGGSGTFSSFNSPSDKTGKEENSNFYVWMLEQQEEFTDRVKKEYSILDEIKKTYESSNSIDGKSNILDFCKKVQHLKNEISNQQHTIENIRISSSMCRFDLWYENLIKSQSRKWVILDVILPLTVGFSSLILLLSEII
ncbi:hypothetical protein [Enterovibrio norvegicus]|uniref:hypothetical protein n=1 Tax=Enterovibrio norvegicus TaxID=188144 RepID=UPI00354CA5C7